MEETIPLNPLLIIKFRKKLFLSVFVVFFALSTFLALSWSSYRSEAVIEVAPSELSENVMRVAGTNLMETQEALADLRISRLQQKVTATGSLAEIITKFNLYPNKRELTPISVIADRMRRAIKVELLSSTLANQAAASHASMGDLSAIAFNLSFTYSDPSTTQLVTNELMSRFLDEDLKERRQQAHETSSFLETQIKILEESLADQEKKIAEFRATTGDKRPETLAFNQQAATNLMLNIQGIDAQIASNESSQATLRSQLATIDPYSRVQAEGQILTTPSVQLKTLRSQYATLTAKYGSKHPDVIKAERQIEALEAAQAGSDNDDSAGIKARIIDLKTRLASSQRAYGPNNPDVITMSHQINLLEQQLSLQTSDFMSNDGIKKDADNPAYIQTAIQLKNAEGQKKALTAQREALVVQQAKYTSAITQNPAAEQQMAILTRDYDNARARYRELREKKMAADMAETMELDRKGQRLSVINPPDLPTKTKPARYIFILGGFFFSLFTASLSVAIKQLSSQSIIGAAQLETIIGTAPLIEIPYLYNASEKKRAQKLRKQIVLSLILAFVVGAVLFSIFIMPFDVFWALAMNKLGL